MNLPQAIVTCLKKSFTFSGRASRSEYFYMNFFIYCISVFPFFIIISLEILQGKILSFYSVDMLYGLITILVLFLPAMFALTARMNNTIKLSNAITLNRFMKIEHDTQAHKKKTYMGMAYLWLSAQRKALFESTYGSIILIFFIHYILFRFFASNNDISLNYLGKYRIDAYFISFLFIYIFCAFNVNRILYNNRLRKSHKDIAYNFPASKSILFDNMPYQDSIISFLKLNFKNYIKFVVIMHILWMVFFIGSISSINFKYTELYYSIFGDISANKDYDKKIANYTKAIEVNPNNACAYNARGLIKGRDKKDYDGAITDFTKAIELKPNYANAYYGRGISKYYKQDYDGAITDLNKAIELKPNYANAYHWRGLIKGKNQKDYVGAITDFTKVIELKPNYAYAYYWRGFIKGKNQKDYVGAITDFTKAIELNPKYADVYYSRIYQGD